MHSARALVDYSTRARLYEESAVGYHAAPRGYAQTNDEHYDSQQVASFYLPLNAGLRFSRKARTPSSLSSDEKQRAKRSTSRRKPSSRLEREASLTASFAMRSATGLFSAMRFAISIVLASRSAAGTTMLTSPML